MGGLVNRRLAAAALAVSGISGPAWANPASTALCNRGSTELYNLQHDRAAATFREAIAADRQDPAAYRGLAGALWLGIAFDRGSMTVDSYLGRVSRAKVQLPPPAAAITTEFQQSIDQALALTRATLSTRPNDPDASFELGAAIGLRASYAATVDGGVLSAFHAAKEAYDAHERVLKLNPGRHDAGLIVGMYRYLVATLSMPLRWMAYAAGFGGGREKGLELIQQAADYGGDNAPDARLALILLYNREERFDEALAQLQKLREQYPLNRLLWLETGATLLRAGRFAPADQFFSDGLVKLSTAPGPRMFGEEALFYYKRGAARAALGRTADARGDLTAALSKPGRNWVHGRAHFELGKLDVNAGRHDTAREHLASAITLCDSDRDAGTADDARQLMK